ncbi:hypothetical protein Taro_000163, partial [Colocasia esculenta]|nr:hypothetical protein [Colocasia esculenta]
MVSEPKVEINSHGDKTAVGETSKKKDLAGSGNTSQVHNDNYQVIVHDNCTTLLEDVGLVTSDITTGDRATNIFCKGSVDTTNLDVDTMVQNKGRNVKKSPSQVDTSPEQDVVVSLCAQVFESSRSRTNIFCKGSVDTTNLGVDTMVQNKGRNVKKSPSQVDTSPEQVDTTPSQVDTKSGSVDTRCLSQMASFAVWDS